MSTDIYAKTEKGRAELVQRNLGLSSKQRTVLILLDGRKPCSALGGLLPAGQVEAIIAELLALGLIAPSVAAAPALSAVLSRVKAEMVETAQSCLGLLAAEVVRRIESAGDERELLAVVGHWHMALQASKHGREAAQVHLERVKESLGQTLPA
jgi:hypothetical protein